MQAREEKQKLNSSSRLIIFSLLALSKSSLSLFYIRRRVVVCLTRDRSFPQRYNFFNLETPEHKKNV